MENQEQTNDIAVEVANKFLDALEEWNNDINMNRGLFMDSLMIGDAHHAYQAMQNLNNLCEPTWLQGDIQIAKDLTKYSNCLQEISKRLSHAILLNELKLQQERN
ncbi:hypothetical protein [Lactobacillus hominis]|nr:hypothetical protein [Lactobacillus hominis]KRM85862.1 hypothetical protein FC41_GL000050 [Lactobacillus hominis DSM 23910 = CRBIP 24.179]MCT3348901.1 hypothetical protein [Lactobacillus hominis]